MRYDNEKKPLYSFFIFSLFLSVLCSCQSSLDKRWESAREAEDSKKFKQALIHYEYLSKNEKTSAKKAEAARQAANITFFQLKDFKKTQIYYERLFFYSKDLKEKIKIQEKIAEINFSTHNKYKKAIADYSRLIKINKNKSDRYVYKLQIARSYFYLNNFYQSRIEVQKIIKELNENKYQIKDEKQRNNYLFQARLLLGNIFVTKKKYQKAAKVFEHLMKDYPQKSIKENVFVNLVLTYKQLDKIDEAIFFLKSISLKVAKPELINFHIQNLEETKKNRPSVKRKKR